MNKSYFEILRAGVNTTLQDEGRPNVYHIGVPFSGAMDRRNYLISNSISAIEVFKSLSCSCFFSNEFSVELISEFISSISRW